MSNTAIALWSVLVTGPVVVVVSPHFDDAVLSCWSVLERHRSDAVVLTVFGGAPRPPLLGGWDAKTGVKDSATRVNERHEENRNALAIAGCASVELDLLESQYGPGDVSPSDLHDRIQDAPTVYAPAGAALDRPPHGDHERVRDAVLAVRPDACLYADQPYCRFRPDFEFAVPVSGAARRVVELSHEEAERKVRAIRCYVKEVPLLEDVWLFGPFVNENTVRYEVFWCQRSRLGRNEPY